MANWIFVPRGSAAKLAYTVTASNQATDHPVTNVALVQYPRRTWKSTTVVDLGASIVIDLGSAKALTDLVLAFANFSSLSVHAGADGTNWPDDLGTYGIPMDRWAGRRQAWLHLSSSAATRRYRRIRPAGVAAGATGFELGSLFALQNPAPLIHNVSWPTWTPVEPIEEVPFDGGARERKNLGPVFVQTQIGNPTVERGTDDAHLREMAAMFRRQTEPFLLYANRDDPSEVYYCETESPVGFVERKAWFGYGASIREVY